MVPSGQYLYCGQAYYPAEPDCKVFGHTLIPAGTLLMTTFTAGFRSVYVIVIWQKEPAGQS